MLTTAYMELRDDDAFWAALRVGAFTDEMIRAIIHTGEFRDAAAEKAVADIMIKRRDKILKVYLPAVNPVVSARLDAEGRLTFDNAAVVGGCGEASGFLSHRVVRVRQRDWRHATTRQRPAAPRPMWRRLTVCPRRTAATSGWTSRRTGRHTRHGAGLSAPTSDARAPAGSWSGWSACRRVRHQFREPRSDDGH